MVDQIVERMIEHLATEPPAIFVTPWLWAAYGVMFLGGFFTDRRVHWEQRPRPRPADFFLGAALVASGVVSMATGATFPSGGSTLWPLLGFTLMAAGLVLRLQATGRLGRDFNGDLRTRPGQTVVTSGPYRWVRHPGYLGVVLYLTGMAVIFGWWPPVVVAVLLLGAYCRARIHREEAINQQGIAGYRSTCAESGAVADGAGLW